MTNTVLNRHPYLRRLCVAALTFVVIFGLAASTVRIWKPIAQRSKWFVVATNMYQDLLRRIHLRADQIGQGAYFTPAGHRFHSKPGQHFRHAGPLTVMAARRC